MKVLFLFPPILKTNETEISSYFAKKIYLLLQILQILQECYCLVFGTSASLDEPIEESPYSTPAESEEFGEVSKFLFKIIGNICFICFQ